MVKLLRKVLHENTNILNTYVTPNSISLAQTLMKFNIHIKYILITLDINDPYGHITINETIQITKYFLQNSAKHYKTKC